MIEESPSPALTPSLREAMGKTAVAAARAVNYRGAGTFEFLFQDGQFYFLEMNTRIQVEHPVTEVITGIDLVQWQIRIAAGEPLAFDQGDVRFSGHAIECRITSEEPANSFLPSTGRIELLEVPAGPGVRWDSGIATGFEVGLYYDPMLAKLIVQAPTRELAMDRMLRALSELRIVGVETSIPFHLAVMTEPEFRSGAYDIRYLEKHGAALTGSTLADSDLEAVALTAAMLEQEVRARRSVPRFSDKRTEGRSRWRDTGTWFGL